MTHVVPTRAGVNSGNSPQTRLTQVQTAAYRTSYGHVRARAPRHTAVPALGRLMGPRRRSCVQARTPPPAAGTPRASTWAPTGNEDTKEAD